MIKKYLVIIPTIFLFTACSNKNQNLIDGVMVYLTSHGKNKNLACECWEKAKKEKVFKIELLINEFCK